MLLLYFLFRTNIIINHLPIKVTEYLLQSEHIRKYFNKYFFVLNVSICKLSFCYKIVFKKVIASNKTNRLINYNFDTFK